MKLNKQHTAGISVGLAFMNSTMNQKYFKTVSTERVQAYYLVISS